MKITCVKSVCFSPTGNTEYAVKYMAHRLAEALGCKEEHIGFTLPAERSEHSFSKSDLVVFGVPVYAGRIPNKALPFVRSLFRADGSPAIAVVTYGNREYESSLTELRDELTDLGFRVFAGAALVAQHSMNENLAKGRPDRKDLEEWDSFLSKIPKKLTADAPEDLPRLSLPGREEVLPYYIPLNEKNEKANFLKAKPLTDESKCDRCGICAKKCPMGSIDFEDPFLVSGICIKCQACIKYCPKGAKFFADEELLSHIRHVAQHYGGNKASNYFFMG